MTSFDYRLNPRYAIKECSSCGALYTGDFYCSKRNVKDKILVPKLPKNYARCGHPVGGPYCQGCALLRKKLKEDLVTYFQDFQNTSESFDDSTNVVNAPREPFVVKQDHGVNSSQNPPHIDECFYECGYALDGISCQQCTCIPNTMCDVHLVNNPTPLEAKDHFEIVINSNDDYSSSDDDSLYNENIEYVEASPHDSELVSLEVAEIVIPEDEEIEDDNLREKLLNVHLLIANIEALKDNPTPSQISSGSTTTHSDISLFEYDSFIFDLSNDQYPPTDRSDFTHEEFADELAHIISPLEYDCLYFRNFPDPGEWISILNSGIHENLSSTTHVNLPVEDDHSPLLAYVVWILLAYLTYPVIPPYLHSFGNEDTIFDPGIAINRFYSFKPGLSHRCRTFKKFSTHRSHLNECSMEMLFSICFPMDQ
nr:hypothetical protein [Tanacetum cinerariifolium]